MIQTIKHQYHTPEIQAIASRFSLKDLQVVRYTHCVAMDDRVFTVNVYLDGQKLGEASNAGCEEPTRFIADLEYFLEYELVVAELAKYYMVCMDEGTVWTIEHLLDEIIDMAYEAGKKS